MRQGRLQPLIHREVAILIQEAHERLLFVLPGRVTLGPCPPFSLDVDKESDSEVISLHMLTALIQKTPGS